MSPFGLAQVVRLRRYVGTHFKFQKVHLTSAQSKTRQNRRAVRCVRNLMITRDICAKRVSSSDADDVRELSSAESEFIFEEPHPLSRETYKA